MKRIPTGQRSTYTQIDEKQAARSSIHTDHTDYMDQHLHIRMIESTREIKTRVGEFCWSRGLRQKKNKNNAILIRSHRLLEIELLGHAIDLHAYRRAVVSLDPLYFTSMRTSLWTWVSCNVVIRETTRRTTMNCAKWAFPPKSSFRLLSFFLSLWRYCFLFHFNHFARRRKVQLRDISF